MRGFAHVAAAWSVNAIDGGVITKTSVTSCLCLLIVKGKPQSGNKHLACYQRAIVADSLSIAQMQQTLPCFPVFSSTAVHILDNCFRV
jgi:hypothetical protein